MSIDEVWRNVLGYEGKYEISNLGRVKSLPKLNGNHMGKERILKPKVDRYGYEVVCLSKNKKHKHPTIHRLVAIAFLHNELNLPQVNHIDGNKLNNHVNNLEWVTPSQNSKHAWDTGLNEHSRKIASEVHGYRCKLINIKDGEIKEFNSHCQLSLFLGYNKHWLSQSVREGTDYKNVCLKKGYIIELS